MPRSSTGGAPTWIDAYAYVYTCVCVCMCVCVCVCVCVYLSIYIYIYLFIDTIIHTYIHTYIHLFIHPHTHTHTHNFTHMHMQQEGGHLAAGVVERYAEVLCGTHGGQLRAALWIWITIINSYVPTFQLFPTVFTIASERRGRHGPRRRTRRCRARGSSCPATGT